MFKVAKNITTLDECVDVRIVNVEDGNIDYGNHKVVKNKIKELEISISGIIDNDKYCLHFIILKPISEYEYIKKYEKIEVEKDMLIDNYIIINGVAYIDPIIDMEILRYGDKLVFSLLFRDYDNEFFGTAEFSVDLIKLQV